MRFEIQNNKILTAMQRTLGDAGYKAYLVGGAVRDTLMGIVPHDYDVATDALPNDVVRLFKRTIPTGIKHGTVTVRLFGQSIETTTFRTDGKYTDGRHPDIWKRAAAIEEDLSRRDFTMNAVAVDLETGEVVDPFNGKGDIECRLIKAVGDAKARFTEDGLRPIRAIRFAAQTGFAIEAATYSAIMDKNVIQKAKSVSMERFRDEFVKMLLTETPAPSLKMLEETGMQEVFLPGIGMDIVSCASAAQYTASYPLHSDAPQCNVALRLAALLHELDTLTARKVLAKLRFPNRTIDDVSHLIANYSFHYGNWSDADVRRFIVKVGKDNIESIFALRLSCIKGEAAAKEAAKLRSRIEHTKCDVLALSDLAVTGKDVIDSGIEAGPKVGNVLNALFQCVLDDPSMNTRQKLLKKIETL